MLFNSQKSFQDFHYKSREFQKKNMFLLILYFYLFYFQEEKKTIKERLQAIQEVSQSVQNTIGYLASLGESVKK